jgi:hypothetical protein
MQLLGTYNSNLASFQYQQLLALLQAAIAAGDLSSGSKFDQSTLLQLEAQATSFANLPTATAGTRALDESILQPVQMLQARLSALSSEANNFVTRSAALTAYLQVQAAFLDQLLAADKLRNWIAGLPSLPGAWSSAWDFSIDQGKVSVGIPAIDPVNGVVYTNELSTGSVLDATTRLVTSGLLPPASPSVIPPKNLIWTYAGASEIDDIYAPDMSWAELTVVEDLPQISFLAQPSVQVVLPVNGSAAGLVSITGSVPGGALPTYLRLLFYPRTQTITTRVTNGVVLNLSAYTIDPDAITVYSLNADGTPNLFFTNGTDFTVDQAGSITPVTIGTNVAVTVVFNENLPAYQCSVDQQTWSDIYMLDPNRPFRDDETVFYPVGIVNGAFPLTDETGLATGLYFTLNGNLPSDFTLLVSTPAASSYGVTCNLEVDLEQSAYCNTLALSPFSAFPAYLTAVQIQSLAGGASTTVFNGSVLVDKALNIKFARQLVSKIILTFVMSNYTVIEYQDLNTDSLRRSTMSTVEASLPFSLGKFIPPVITTARGYQYAIGFSGIQAMDVEPTLPGVLVQGPVTVPGCPLVVRLDEEAVGTCSVYLCYQAFNAAGVLVDENTKGVLMTPATSFIVPYTTGVVLASIASTQITLKVVLRDAGCVFSRYNLQAVLL